MANWIKVTQDSHVDGKTGRNESVSNACKTLITNKAMYYFATVTVQFLVETFIQLVQPHPAKVVFCYRRKHKSVLYSRKAAFSQGLKAGEWDRKSCLDLRSWFLWTSDWNIMQEFSTRINKWWNYGTAQVSEGEWQPVRRMTFSSMQAWLQN